MKNENIKIGQNNLSAQVDLYNRKPMIEYKLMDYNVGNVFDKVSLIYNKKMSGIISAIGEYRILKLGRYWKVNTEQYIRIRFASDYLGEGHKAFCTYVDSLGNEYALNFSHYEGQYPMYIDRKNKEISFCWGLNELRIGSTLVFKFQKIDLGQEPLLATQYYYLKSIGDLAPSFFYFAGEYNVYGQDGTIFRFNSNNTFELYGNNESFSGEFDSLNSIDIKKDGSTKKVNIVNTNNNIEKITDENNYTIEFKYNASNVTGIKEISPYSKFEVSGAFQEYPTTLTDLSISYNGDNITVTNEQGISITQQYDFENNISAIYEEKAGNVVGDIQFSCGDYWNRNEGIISKNKNSNYRILTLNDVKLEFRDCFYEAEFDVSEFDKELTYTLAGWGETNYYYPNVFSEDKPFELRAVVVYPNGKVKIHKAKFTSFNYKQFSAVSFKLNEFGNATSIKLQAVYHVHYEPAYFTDIGLYVAQVSFAKNSLVYSTDNPGETVQCNYNEITAVKYNNNEEHLFSGNIFAPLDINCLLRDFAENKLELITTQNGSPTIYNILGINTPSIKFSGYSNYVPITSIKMVTDIFDNKDHIVMFSHYENENDAAILVTEQTIYSDGQVNYTTKRGEETFVDVFNTVHRTTKSTNENIVTFLKESTDIFSNTISYRDDYILTEDKTKLSAINSYEPRNYLAQDEYKICKEFSSDYSSQTIRQPKCPNEPLIITEDSIRANISGRNLYGTTEPILNRNEFKYTEGLITRLNHNETDYYLEYDGAEVLKKVTFGGKSMMSRDFNKSTRTEVLTLSGHEKTIKYDAYGRIENVKESNRYIIENTYGDAVGQNNASAKLIKSKDNIAGTESFYDYDLLGELKSIKTLNSTGEVVSGIDIVKDKTLSRVETVSLQSDGNSSVYSYGYDPKSGAENTVRLQDKFLSRVTNDNLGRLSGKQLTNDSSGDIIYTESLKYKAVDSGQKRYTEFFPEKEVFTIGSKVRETTYGRDKNGNISSIHFDNQDTITNRDIIYEYDSQNRLTFESLNGDEKTYYTYDHGGNIKTKQHYKQSTGELVTINYAYENNVWRDRLTRYNGKSIIYDDNGNPRNYMGSTISWARGKMTEWTNKNIQAKYSYDANGVRINKEVIKGRKRNLHTYFMLGTRLLREKVNILTEGDVEPGVYVGDGKYAGSGIWAGSYGKADNNIEETQEIIYYYDESGITGINYNEVNYYFRKNLLGDVTEIYDGYGVRKGAYRYNAWGECTILQNDDGIAEINPIRYRSYYYDTETGLYYLNSRYYDPEIGRFISPDSIGYLDPETINGLNLYAYCGDNPVMRVDPSGTSWWSDFWNGVGNWWSDNWQKGLMNIGSSLLTIAGIVSIFVPGGQLFTASLLGAGVSSLVGGFTNEAMGGSFLGGWIGGLITGAISGLFPSANIQVAFGLGFAGGFTGTMITGLIDGKKFSDLSLWGSSLLAGVGDGIFNMALSVFKPAFEVPKASDWFNAAVAGYTMYFGGISAFRSWLLGLVTGAIMG